MPITALYAALLAFLLLPLSARVIARRRAQQVELGDGADKELFRRIRVHANFIEYAPFFLVLMGLAESLAAPHIALHLLGAAFIIGRLSHAYGLSQTPHILKFRVTGMVLTLNAIIVAAVLCLVLAAGRGLA